MNIKGAVAVITGAAGGMGRALALEMAKRKVTGLALVDHSEGVQQVAKAVNDFAGENIGIWLQWRCDAGYFSPACL